jgi:hypothetical protein
MNWLFSDTVRGAESSAICYSIVETAKSNGINPYKYLNFLFSELPTVLTNGLLLVDTLGFCAYKELTDTQNQLALFYG